jgi:hypothetical protein
MCRGRLATVAVCARSSVPCDPEFAAIALAFAVIALAFPAIAVV